MRNRWSEWMSQLQGTVGFLGLGNEAWGDDALGLVLARALQARGVLHVHEAGTNPERWITEPNVRPLNHLVFLDAVDWGGAPGEVVLLAQSEILQRFPQISTHKLSLGLLAACVASFGHARSWLLGVQFETLSSVNTLSSRVRESVDALAELLASDLAKGPRQEPWFCPPGFGVRQCPGALGSDQAPRKRQSTAALQDANAPALVIPRFMGRGQDQKEQESLHEPKILTR